MDQASSLDFGDLLKAFRKSRHLTQEQLAERTGNSRQTVGNWERGMKLPKSRPVLIEVAKVLRLSEQETRQLIEASFASPLPQWLVPYPRNLLFTGREDSLATLHRLISAEKTVVLTQSYAIHGIGGVGKTQLALEYAYRHKLEYRAIFWIAAETLELITTSFLAIAASFELTECKQTDQQQIIAAVQRWLNKQRGWLLIWDNLEDLDAFSRFLTATPFGAHLITTRTRVHGTLARGFELHALPPEHALLFLLRRAKLLDPFATPRELALWARHHIVEYQAARTITSLLECLPLALDQAGAYIEETSCGLAGYLDRFQKQRKLLLARRGSPDAGHPESVTTTFMLAYQRLEKDHFSATELLKIAAFLGADNIPEELFKDRLPVLGSALREVLGQPVELDFMLAALLRYSLIQRHGETRCFSLHRLAQAVQQEALGEEDQRQWAEVAVRLVAAAFPDSKDFANWEVCQRLLPHALICVDHIHRWGFTFLEGADLLNEVGAYLRQRGQLQDALPLLQQGLEIREAILGSEHLDVADSLNDLGGYHTAAGNLLEALTYFQRALNIRQKCLGNDHLLVAKSLNNLAFMYSHLGKIQEAMPIYKAAIAIFERTLGADHPFVAVSLSNLADMYFGLGQYEQAKETHLRALTIRERTLEPGNPDIAISLNGLGGVYAVQGQYAEAVKYHQRGLSIREKAFGPEHPDVALSLYSLADDYCKQGEYTQAESLTLRSLAIREKQLGGDNPETAKALSQLAYLFAMTNRWGEARKLFQRALAIQELRLGKEHPDTVQTREMPVKLARLQGLKKGDPARLGGEKAFIGP